jgi:hypothetical protein
MRLKTKSYVSSVALAAALFSAANSGAQQKAVPQVNMAYDVSHESVVQGTVISYVASSEVAPVGPHVKIQTSSGVVDVHLGNAQFLKQNDVVLSSGDSVKLVGQSQDFGTGPVFLARVLRKGSQTVTLRNLNGIPYQAKPTKPAQARAAVVSLQGGAR